jgi:hypothetical protein
MKLWLGNQWTAAMANPCNEHIVQNRVDMRCSTTKCNLALADTAQHLTDIFNNRGNSVHDVEICSVALNGYVDFNGSTKSVTQYITVGRYSSAPTTTIILNPVRTGTDEILTTVEFEDRLLMKKESYPVDYEMYLV